MQRSSFLSEVLLVVVWPTWTNVSCGMPAPILEVVCLTLRLSLSSLTQIISEDKLLRDPLHSVIA